ncbi:hypothetical protein OG875_10740 [Streptomyces sp. NBC_01498]|nr:hypothetical protein OG875_10740 [Streptomyces sp. NBC_01498]
MGRRRPPVRADPAPRGPGPRRTGREPGALRARAARPRLPAVGPGRAVPPGPGGRRGPADRRPGPGAGRHSNA